MSEVIRELNKKLYLMLAGTIASVITIIVMPIVMKNFISCLIGVVLFLLFFWHFWSIRSAIKKEHYVMVRTKCVNIKRPPFAYGATSQSFVLTLLPVETDDENYYQPNPSNEETFDIQLISNKIRKAKFSIQPDDYIDIIFEFNSDKFETPVFDGSKMLAYAKVYFLDENKDDDNDEKSDVTDKK